ncbi:phage baseplate assembly protein V [Myxacorys almedinensis]|uniref:Phage tail protein n=1 Tax=Myxacorys almedinensis A TaxID=2690445 RepID=A0A8J7Z1K3_9CYAN|nr:phage baseplate assembly protein V [Myxacorys almedinensis]NDJ16463.1 phage tail protein [Myxacorys almedinensis A]
MTGRDVLADLLGSSNTSSQFYYGVTVGLVTNTKDEAALGRVKVKLPWMSNDDESDWARVLTPMAGANRGIYFPLEVNDEVLVAFEHGNIDEPYILGALWNGKDAPPDSNKQGKNNIRMIKSRSGHVIILDDTDGEEKIIIRDKTQNNEILIDSKTDSVTLKVKKNFKVEAQGDITLKSSGDVAIEGNNVSIEANKKCEIRSQNTCTVQATKEIALNCLSGVNVNYGALEVK